jgi:hypothetical protein
MNWFSLIPVLLPEIVNLFSSNTSATQPSAGVKQLQHLINTYFPPSPPLVEDGWLGPNTDAAIMSALNKLGPLLSGLLSQATQK